jgi:hypothetical protein
MTQFVVAVPVAPGAITEPGLAFRVFAGTVHEIVLLAGSNLPST